MVERSERETYSNWLTACSFTALLRVREEKARALADALSAAGNAVGKREDIPLHRIAGLHFLRLQVISDPLETYGPELLVNAVFDGGRVQFLDSLANALEGWLQPLLLECCRDVADGLTETLERAATKENAVYASQLDGRLSDVRSEAALMAFLQSLADEQRANGRWGSGVSAESIRKEMRGATLASKRLDLPTGPRPGLSLSGRARRLFDAALAVADPFSGLLRDEMRKRFLTLGKAAGVKRLMLRLGLGIHFLYSFVPRWWFLGRIRKLERQERYEPYAVDRAEVERLLEREDVKTQNPLTLTARVRDGAWRRWTLGRVLKGSAKATRHLWDLGELAGIATIHYARLYQVDRGRRFLFLSDYDGSWDRYLGDFLGPGKLAVVPIFGHLRGCPQTEGLFNPTPKFGSRFLSFTRFSMSPVQFWYSAWPDLSVADRLRNRRVREGLFRASMSESEAEAWLADF